MGMPKSGVLLAPTVAPSQTALTSGVARTPSTTRPTLVVVTFDWNTVANSSGRTGTVTIDGVATDPVGVWNADAVSGLAISMIIIPVRPSAAIQS